MNVLNELNKYSEINPKKIAVFSERYAFTYEEVNRISGNIAYQIHNCIGKNNRVLIDLPHSISTIIGILAVLKSGNTYVPIEQNIIQSKKINIIEQTNCAYVICSNGDNYYGWNSLVLSDDSLRSHIYQNNFLDKVDFPEIPYILFTSGSTGNPKGVKITKKNLWYILDNMQRISPVEQSSVYCFSTPYTFDVSITEIFGWIIGNGSVAVFDVRDLNKFRNLISLIDKYKISHFCASPSVLMTIFNMCSKSDYEVISNNIRYLMVAGERFDPKLAQIWHEQALKCHLLNLYGPTEATVYATYHEVTPDDLNQKEIPIGLPLKNARVEILEKDDKGCGELVIYGEGIADGYLNNNELTNKFFGEVETGERYYKTGDIVYEYNNELVFLYRKDNQIQIHGIRIELGEIEYYLSNEYDINKSVVIYSNNKLIAFLQPQNSQFNIYEFEKRMREKLPLYLHPNEYVVLSDFPLTTSGKIDRKRLMQEYDLRTKLTEYNANNFAFSNDESIIANLFSSELKIAYDRISKKSDFFELGGDSLSVISCLVFLETYYKREFDVDLFYTYRTVEEIAKHVQKEAQVIDNKENIKIDITQVQKQQFVEYSTIQHTDIEIKKYLTHYVQRSYFYKKYDGFLSFKANYDNSFDLCDIEEAIKRVIRTHPLLRSIIVEIDSDLYFSEFELDFNRHIIPIIEVEDCDLKSYINRLEMLLKPLLYNARYNNKLMAYFCILKAPSGYTVYCAVDHCIVDGASLNILRKDIGLSLSKGELPMPRYTYQHYCEEIRKNNNLNFVLKHEYTSFLQGLNLHENKKKLFDLVDESELIYENECDLIDSEEVSILASYISAEKLSDKLDTQSIIVNSILNIRKFKLYDFSYTIGDMHTRVPLVYNKNETFDEFYARAKDVIENIYKRNFFCPRYTALCNYPAISSEQEYINNIYEKQVKISFSFLGIQTDEDFNVYKSTIRDIHKGLQKLAKHQLFVTGIINRGRLYLYSNKKISSD
ncbi:MAG: non-ribosomal peptide synthetase [Clostridium argentinense]|uniref:non-ribosomal peptide synthetase n=1 Tax=uncultured Clostridium sp. TaxID=59620 RepID=UPI001D4EC926|nr:non-ribosomal peptide synthetase [uncultured Clostridium sp.]MBS5824686.1 non-ribosomal peptide synthetase [Clostridium argentinense]MDU1350867.1 non-ribosomal peptide synthetase [Clostridium argentinense]